MLPIFLYCVRWGFGPGMLASAAYAVLQLLLDGAYAWSWQSIIGDYLVAFSVLGVSGLFHGVKGGFYWGTAVGSVLRFLCHLVTGATVWAEYMPEKFFGLTMKNMPVVSSQYWNQVHGYKAEDVLKDEEGLQTVRTMPSRSHFISRPTSAAA